jgi:hypothetical protein
MTSVWTVCLVEYKTSVHTSIRMSVWMSVWVTCLVAYIESISVTSLLATTTSVFDITEDNSTVVESIEASRLACSTGAASLSKINSLRECLEVDCLALLP